MPQRRRPGPGQVRRSATRGPSALPARPPASQTEASPVSPPSATPQGQARVAARPRLAARDYGYVLKELRMIGLLSAGIIAIILLLALILR